MISIDTNILLFAQNQDCPEHERAYEFIRACGEREDVILCELVLAELYLLLRNPAVIPHPLKSQDACRVCQSYRQHPRWRLVENGPVMSQVWDLAETSLFPRRRIIDARLAFTLRHHGVKELATANIKDFEGFGFQRVWNPLAEA